MRRGDVIAVTPQGDFAKPRPAVIVQADDFSDIPSLTVLLFTSDLRDAPAIRIPIEPDKDNGLQKTSQIMVDKITTVSLKRIGRQIGRLSDEQMVAVDRSLAVFLGLV